MNRLGLRGGVLLAAAIGLLLAASSGAAEAAWSVRGSGTRAYVEGTSQAGGLRVRLFCDESVKLYFYPPPAWDGNNIDPTSLAIDGERTLMTADGVDEGVLLSDRPGGAVGITSELLERIRGGSVLVIASAAATRIPASHLTFPLAGAAAAIGTFARSCPAARS